MICGSCTAIEDKLLLVLAFLLVNWPLCFADSIPDEWNIRYERFNDRINQFAGQRAKEILKDLEQQLDPLDASGWYRHKGKPILKSNRDGVQPSPSTHDYAYGHLHYSGRVWGSTIELELDIPILPDQTAQEICKREIEAVRKVAFENASQTGDKNKARISSFAKYFEGISPEGEIETHSDKTLIDIDQQTDIEIKINMVTYALEYSLETIEMFYPAAHCKGELTSHNTYFFHNP